MAGEVRGAKEEGKGSFLLAENPKKQTFTVCGRGEGRYGIWHTLSAL